MIGKYPIIVCFYICFGGIWTFTIYETPQRIEADGFPAETHHVTTTDGYILEMHRIPYGRSGSDGETRPVVFLMHGLSGASNAYLRLGPENSIAYNLADAGFDVWLGNARVNKNSRRHVTLNPDNDVQKYAFFDFTFEEIAMHDLPAMIDYILEHTSEESLHYIGHSQGGTIFLILNSMRMEYNYKIRSAHLLAAVGYQEYFPDEQLKAMAENTDVIYQMALLQGIVEVYPPGSTDMVNLPREGVAYNVSDYCTGNVEQRDLCDLIGINKILRDDTVFDDDVGGAALKQFAHYGQNIRDKLFQRYHYGNLNMMVYGSEEPPLYDLSLITCPVIMHYTVSDHMLDERDVFEMAQVMPNTVVRKVARETFGHSDFVAASDVKELVTDYIIEALKDSDEVQHPDFTTNTGVIVVDHDPDTTESTLGPIPDTTDSDATTVDVETEFVAPEDNAASHLPRNGVLFMIVLSLAIML